LTPQQLQFLLRVTPPALESERVYEVPACVTIAQAILESATAAGWGSSVLFRLANNPFGIKYCHFGTRDSGLGTRDLGFGTRDTGLGRLDKGLGTGDLGQGNCDSRFQIQGSEFKPPVPSTQHPAPAIAPYGAFDAQTWEIVNGQKKVMIAQFQRFPNLAEAFTAHALLLRAPHYRSAFSMRHDWKQFAERLGPKTSPLDSEHCGYSTNPSYSAELIKLVNLYRLNDPRAIQWYATGKDPGNRVIEPSDHLAIEQATGRSGDGPWKSSAASNQ